MADEKFPTVFVRWKVTIRSDMTIPKNLAVQHCCYQQDCCHWTFLQSVKCWRPHWVRVCCKERESAAVAWGSCVHRSRRGAPHWCGTQRAGDNVQTSAISPYLYQRSESSEHYGFWFWQTPYCCHVVVWEFEFYQRQAQKRHSSSPLTGAGPKRKRGRCATVCSQSNCV